MNGLWTRHPERGSATLLRLMIWLTQRFGSGLGHMLLYPIALYYLLLTRTARAASSDFLRRALGRPPSWRERFRHILTFARTIMDRFMLLGGRLDDYEVKVEGRETIDRLVGEGSGCILLGAHYGSFEILRAIADRGCPTPVRMLMYEDNASRLQGMLAAINPKAQRSIIRLGLSESMLRVKEALDAGEMVGILGDRIVAGDKVVSVDFLGRPAIFPAGPIVLASVLKVPVVLFSGTHLGTRRYAVRFELLAERVVLGREQRDADIARWVARYVRALEAQCRRHPFNWFNFYDFWNVDPQPRRVSRGTAVAPVAGLPDPGLVAGRSPVA